MWEAFTNWEIGVLHFCGQPTGSTGLACTGVACTGLACTGLPGSPGIFVRQASGASGLVAKVQNPNFLICKCILRHPGASNKKEGPQFNNNSMNAIVDIYSTYTTRTW